MYAQHSSRPRHLPHWLPGCALLAVLAIGGCERPAFLSFPPQARGHFVDDDDMKELVPGTSTQGDVTALLGSPTARSSFDDSEWLYISEVTKPVIAGTNEIRKQGVLVVRFNQSGVLQSMTRKGDEDAQPVDVVSRKTPSPGTEASFLQQLLGNVGKFNAAGPANGGGSNPVSGF